MLLSWNACWEELRSIGTFCLIPQLEYGSNDCTGDFFPRKFSREKRKNMCKSRNQNLPSSGEKLTSNVFSGLVNQHPLNLMWFKNLWQISSFPLFVNFGQETFLNKWSNRWCRSLEELKYNLGNFEHIWLVYFLKERETFLVEERKTRSCQAYDVWEIIKNSLLTI